MTDTDNETVDPVDDEVASPDVPELTFPEKARQFKVNATNQLHEWARVRGHCSDFDREMIRLGLPPRERYLEGETSHTDDDGRAVSYNGDVMLSVDQLTGEETEDDFNTWKSETEGKLWAALDRYGFGQEADRAIEDAGFRGRPQFVYKTVKVTGTFEFETQVQIREGDDIVAHTGQGDRGLTEDLVRRLVSGRWHTDEVTWKATDPSATQTSEDDAPSEG